MNLNKVFILGRVTADPQLRTTPGGQSVTSFSVATNRVWSDKSGLKQEETEFHNIVAWGRTAEIACQYLTKGALVLIEGRLKTRSWTDKQGQARKSVEIITERLQLGPKPAGVARGNLAEAPAKPAGVSSASEEIPVINIEEGGVSEIKPEDIPF